MASFYITEDVQDDDLAVIAVGGEIDFAVSPQLKACIDGHIAAGHKRMIVDLTMASFIDSSAIGVLAGASMQLSAKRSASFVLVCPPENRKILRICEIAGLEGVVDICDSRAEATADQHARRRSLQHLAR
jgi:anti-sigma B factor antagonist